MRIGYARVSTGDQSHDLQIDALTAAHCERIFTETASGAKRDRSILSDALNVTRKGDVLVVWRLDRLGRSLRDLIDISIDLKARGVELLSLGESIDTSSVAGRLYFHIMGAVAESERERIRERALAGLAAARARGAKTGRPRVLSAEQEQAVLALYDSNKVRVGKICEQFHVSRDTIWRTVQKLRALEQHQHPPRREAIDGEKRQAG